MTPVTDATTFSRHYARHAHEGRAVLVGTKTRPLLWLTRPLADRDVYALCFEAERDILLYDGHTRLADIGHSIRIVQSKIAHSAHFEMMTRQAS